MELVIRLALPTDLESLLPALVLLLMDTVNAGVPLGFLPPVSRMQAEAYWQSLRPDMESGRRLLLIAHHGGRLVGSGQLYFPASPNAWHRTELQKLFVASGTRGQGVGRQLLTALHTAARDRGCSLVILHTRKGEPAEQFYRGLEYREAGVLPGYTIGGAGERYDSVLLYRELAHDS